MNSTINRVLLYSLYVQNSITVKGNINSLKIGQQAWEGSEIDKLAHKCVILGRHWIRFLSQGNYFYSDNISFITHILSVP